MKIYMGGGSGGRRGSLVGLCPSTLCSCSCFASAPALQRHSAAAPAAAPAGGPSAAQLHRHLAPNTPWTAARLMSLTPHLRQLQALVAAQSLPPRMLRELLTPQAPAPGAPAPAPDAAAAGGTVAAVVGLPPGLQDALRQRYNPSQQAAISAALAGFHALGAGATGPGGRGASSVRGGPTAGAGASSAAAGGQASAPAGAAAAAAAVAAAPPAHLQPCFTLIQGPPGTGKTAAIIGMLSGLLVGNATRAAKRGTGGGGSASAAAGGQGGAAGQGESGPAEVINPTIRWVGGRSSCWWY